MLLPLAFPVCHSKAQHYNISEELWDTQFSKGKWDYLTKDAVERARNSVISGVFALSYAANGRVLDVGCGEGVLSDYLTHKQRKQYLGIDLSKEAIKIASRRRPGLKFLQANALAYIPPEGVTYDVIVFNEMLYYTDHKEILKKYSTKQFLSKNGIIVISVWYNSKEDYLRASIFTAAKSLLESVDAVVLSGATVDLKFQIEAFRPRN
jgi:2-polyprenyl-3-methyl-5-hydroxy-6-metoxy-1,4-benzoquinol methylase